MNGDGTSPTNSGLNFAPVSFPVPSSRTYSNGRRWWLITIGSGTETSYADLAATNGVWTIRLTSSGPSPINNGDVTVSYIRFSPSSDKASWSNDGQDSFCSVLGPTKQLVSELLGYSAVIPFGD